MKFAGHGRDLANTTSAADDLDYMHARFYNPQVGRLQRVDPKGRYDAMKAPQHWNRYAYCLGNPATYTDPDGQDVTYSNPSDQKFYEAAAKRNWRVRAVLDAFAPGTGRDLHITRGDPGVHPGSGTPLEARTDTYEREATPEEVRAAYDAAAAKGGDQAGTAAAQALVDKGVQLREATIILGAQVSSHQELHELGHVEQSLKEPEKAAQEAEAAKNAPTQGDYKKSASEQYAEQFAKDAKKKDPLPP